MIAKAVSRYNRISPKKARLITRPLKGRTVAEAYALLGNINKKASRFVYKILKSAFDNAHKKDAKINETDLYISKIVVDTGPMLKRYRAGSMGRAFLIRKRTSHFAVELDVIGSRKEGAIEIKKAVKRPFIFKKAARSEKKKKPVDKKVRSTRPRKLAAGRKK